MQVFTIAPAELRGLWLLASVIAIVLIVVTWVVGTTISGARNTRFEVSPEGLRINGDFYGRLISANELRRDQAVRVNFSERPELTPGRRTMGTGLPGYQAGWFRLRNGESALLYLTDRDRAVYIPTTLGHSVIVSPADPDAFLTALSRMDQGPGTDQGPRTKD